jgi:pyruvate/2-oxoglutarate dehydrogenase complex dihydrolipoamide dehydrogenase (E3) component
MGLEIRAQSPPTGPKWVARKDAIVSGFTKGVTGLVQSNNINIYNGIGVAAAPGRGLLKGHDNAELDCKAIILATGSELSISRLFL